VKPGIDYLKRPFTSDDLVPKVREVTGEARTSDVQEFE
jgi:hypothetical protein